MLLLFLRTWYFDDVPSARFPVIGQVDMLLVQMEAQRHLVAVESPRSEFKQAGLLVEREVCDVDGARALFDMYPTFSSKGRWVFILIIDLLAFD